MAAGEGKIQADQLASSMQSSELGNGDDAVEKSKEERSVY